MKIIYTLPGITVPHGGYRICMEHLTRLQRLGYEVGLFVENGKNVCPWYEHSFPIHSFRNCFKAYDIIVIGSPHSIWIQEQFPKKKIFLFMQMVEELFRPNDALWARQCKQFYLSPHPIIHGSHWGEAHCRSLGRTGTMHYIDNGVNFEHFPIENEPKGKVILLESPFSPNPVKDTDLLAYKVAKKIKDEDPSIEIIGYGATPGKGLYHLHLTEYFVNPSVETIDSLYSAATILVKATKYDARALSPVEAGTKRTVTARAITLGDDDLVDNENCLRCEYEYSDLLDITRSLMYNIPLRNALGLAIQQDVKNKLNWDTIIPNLESILVV